MFIGPVPQYLQNIPDDGRGVREIIAALERRDVVVFEKPLFFDAAEPTPPPGTVYNFLGVHSGELSLDIRATADQIYAAVIRERSSLTKPSLRSLLFLQERMTQRRLWADLVAMNQPVANASGVQVLIVLSREDEDGVSWIGAANANVQPVTGDEIVLFLGESSL